ncbi:outer membrane protein transport protein [Tistrella sp. BH-R2-4]|uniref:Outer membrane protein transport protein n=1 Tax=Tistrella arctica TaxID=3133430 RepID=A0ABU9YMT1_9PROT
MPRPAPTLRTTPGTASLTAATATAIVMILAAGPVSAAGFFIQEQSVQGVGRAFAGDVALGEDASTIFTNPAGMTRLKGRQAQLGGHYLILRATLTDTGSSATTLGSGGASVPLGGGDGGNPFDDTPVPNLYAAAPVDDEGRLWLGVGISAPFGLVADYQDDWFGRYDSTKTDLKTIDIAPSIAFKAAHWLSVGAGFDIQYADATLENAVPNGLAPGGPSAATDGHARVQGDDWSVGYNLGAQFTLTPALRLGVHYRSAISHDLKGTASLTGLTGPLAVANFNTDGSAALDLPAIASAGVAWDATDRLTLLGQVNWYEWSRFHEIRVKFSNGLPDSVKQQNYEDSYGVSLGAQYRLNEAWTLRGGAQWDETPTVNGFRTTRTPDGDRLWLSTGASWAISDAVSLDMAYAHIFVDDATIDLDEPAGAGTGRVRVKADVESSIDIVSLQARLRF